MGWLTDDFVPVYPKANLEILNGHPWRIESDKTGFWYYKSDWWPEDPEVTTVHMVGSSIYLFSASGFWRKQSTYMVLPS
jgi:hypothetical protein